MEELDGNEGISAANNYLVSKRLNSNLSGHLTRLERTQAFYGTESFSSRKKFSWPIRMTVDPVQHFLLITLPDLGYV